MKSTEQQMPNSLQHPALNFNHFLLQNRNPIPSAFPRFRIFNEWTLLPCQNIHPRSTAKKNFSSCQPSCERKKLFSFNYDELTSFFLPSTAYYDDVVWVEYGKLKCGEVEVKWIKFETFVAGAEKKSERYSCHVLKLISTLLFLPFQIKNLLGMSISRIFTIFSTYFFALSIPCSYAKLHSASNKAHTWVLYGVGIYDAWEISLCFKCENFFSERIMVGGIKENYFKISNQTASHVRSIFQLIHLHVTFCMLVKRNNPPMQWLMQSKIKSMIFPSLIQ